MILYYGILGLLTILILLCGLYLLGVIAVALLYAFVKTVMWIQKKFHMENKG